MNNRQGGKANEVKRLQKNVWRTNAEAISAPWSSSRLMMCVCVADLFQILAKFFFDFSEPSFLPLNSIHFVHHHNHLPHTQSVSQESMLTGLAVLTRKERERKRKQYLAVQQASSSQEKKIGNGKQRNKIEKRQKRIERNEEKTANPIRTLE